MKPRLKVRINLPNVKRKTKQAYFGAALLATLREVLAHPYSKKKRKDAQERLRLYLPAFSEYNFGEIGRGQSFKVEKCSDCGSIWHGYTDYDFDLAQWHYIDCPRVKEIIFE